MSLRQKQTSCKYKSRSLWNYIPLKLLIRDKQIIYLRQADYMQRNSLLIKVQLWNLPFTKNCVTWTEILSVLFLIVVIFHITPGLILSENWRLIALFSTKMKEEGTQPQEHHVPVPFYLNSMKPLLLSIKP